MGKPGGEPGDQRRETLGMQHFDRLKQGHIYAVKFFGAIFRKNITGAFPPKACILSRNSSGGRNFSLCKRMREGSTISGNLQTAFIRRPWVIQKENVPVYFDTKRLWQCALPFRHPSVFHPNRAASPKSNGIFFILIGLSASVKHRPPSAAAV